MNSLASMSMFKGDLQTDVNDIIYKLDDYIKFLEEYIGKDLYAEILNEKVQPLLDICRVVIEKAVKIKTKLLES